MRVLFVTRKYPPRVGGMESLSYGLTTGFPGPKTIIALGRSQKHLVWFLPYAFARVALTGHRYDVICLGDALLSAVGLVPRVLFKRRIAISVHGLDLTFPNRLYQAYLKHFLRADVFIANSESTRRLAEARGLEPVRTITIGVPEQYFRLARVPVLEPELERLRAGRVLLLTVGRLVRRKGVAWFVRHVLPKLSGVLYVVVGVGPERDAILRAARETGMTENLCLLGKVSEARLLELLGGCDVFVMPNIEVPGDVEGFGIVAIEAAASGLPVVAARLEGIPDAIADGQNGHLIESGNAAAFVEVLEPLTRDAAERARQGQRGRSYTEQQNAWPRIIARYVELFDELTGSG
jgi:phosphatidylinositol alpha-1,6-mannosyltransferase